MNVDVSSWNCLNWSLGSISEEWSQINLHVLFCNIEMWESWEHKRIIILLFWELVLQSDNLKALTANLASVNWTLSYEIEHFFMWVRIIFNTWSHTNNNSPRWIRGENKHWVVYCTELWVYDWLHFMPLIEFNSILSDWGTEWCCSVSVCSVALR